MSGVQADPKEIRKFQSGLRQFNQQLDALAKKLRGQLRALSTSWKDAEYRKFEQEMNEAVNAINRYLQQSDEYVRYLDKKAEPLERYIGQR